MLTLSVKQPFAWLIVNGFKDIENRTWRTNHRGPLAIHASRTGAPITPALLALCRRLRIQLPDEFQCGGIVGVVTVVDCVMQHGSPWFQGPIGWVLRDGHPVEFREMTGKVGLFHS